MPKKKNLWEETIVELFWGQTPKNAPALFSSEIPLVLILFISPNLHNPEDYLKMRVCTLSISECSFICLSRWIPFWKLHSPVRSTCHILPDNYTCEPQLVSILSLPQQYPKLPDVQIKLFNTWVRLFAQNHQYMIDISHSHNIKCKAYNILVWFTYIAKWLSLHH